MINSSSETRYLRTCQECGHKQFSQVPSLPMTNSYADTKCRACKSRSLDFGRPVEPGKDSDDRGDDFGD